MHAKHMGRCSTLSRTQSLTSFHLSFVRRGQRFRFIQLHALTEVHWVHSSAWGHVLCPRVQRSSNVINGHSNAFMTMDHTLQVAPMHPPKLVSWLWWACAWNDRLSFCPTSTSPMKCHSSRTGKGPVCSGHRGHSLPPLSNDIQCIAIHSHP
jgi:hypothetical protein